jgi:hypothetical protein
MTGCQAVMIPEPEDTFSMPSSHVLPDQVEIAFDDERVVASAGLLLPTQAASCSPWSTPWSPVGTASTTWRCCDQGRPPACSATG